MIVNVLMCMIVLANQCVSVQNKVIIVNSNNGNDNTECCVNGDCACSSLSTALLNIDNNTIINITSQSVALNNFTTMGSGKLTNIAITGSNVTIMCNNSGSVYCESCDDVMIEGITWDRCGNPNGTNIAGVTFNGTSNISIINCTFQHSEGPTIYLLKVSNNILIHGCNFLSNIPKQILSTFIGTVHISRESSGDHSRFSNITITIFEGYFYNNGYLQNISDRAGFLSSLYIHIDDESVENCNVNLIKTKFKCNRNAGSMRIAISKLIDIQFIEVSLFNNSFLHGIGGAGIVMIPSSSNGDIVFSIVSSIFNANEGSDVWCIMQGNKTSIAISNTTFGDSKITENSAVAALNFFSEALTVVITFYRVQFSDNSIGISKSSEFTGVVSINTFKADAEISMYMVTFSSNQCLGPVGGALSILLTGDSNSIFNIHVKECQFVGNESPSHGAALFIYTEQFEQSNIQIESTCFDRNLAGSSVVYITQDGFTQFNNNINLQINALTFTNNVGSSMYLSACNVKSSGISIFENNTAENGGAMYLNQGTSMKVRNNTNLKFFNNTATQNGGAIYVDLICDNLIGSTSTFFYDQSSSAIFINNLAKIAGNSLYFYIPRYCLVYTNISDSRSILHVPCQFNYSQTVKGKMIPIPCDLNYTLPDYTGAPIVTSPHELRLYFPFNDGYNISSTSDHKVYFVKNNILGHPVKFTGAVFDYFGKPTVPTQFNIQLHCLHSTECLAYSLIGGNYDHVLTMSIDNFTILNTYFKGKDENINLTLVLTSVSYSLYKINTTLVVELVTCVDHPGYMYSEDSKTCVCYHNNVKCNDDGNEIKRGHWFGSIDSKATTSLCPNRYCEFTNRAQTSEGYFELPNTINAQCNHHRVRRACGECISGYTLSYDSTDCINEDQCSTGWTVLVITLTCLYWITVVAGVFSLMYFMSDISLGYLYGLIYYYSMVTILLDNNSYISNTTFQFVSVLSSFAQLNPLFLGKLCFVKELSGIDQLFIHYSHAVSVSLLLLLIVVATRFSPRISLLVSRCIIRVICLLILLSYTSIASTSLQLLQPLRFTDIEEVYTYSSPHIQYFHGRHAVYGVMAIICELVVGISLPLLLLLEPFLSRKINFVRIKPLLDQFQGCYKDRYRCFAGYYLLCRQVIFLIVHILNSNYYHMLFYLQTACIAISMIHMCIQPYQNEFLNAFDGVMLLLIVLVVNINISTFLRNVAMEIVLAVVVLPLILFGIFAIKKVICFCLMKRRYGDYDPVNDLVDDENATDVVIRQVTTLCALHVIT